jgi:hypothetical protein
MISTTQFRFNELKVQPSDLEEIMGYEEGCSPDPFPELYQTGLSMAADVCEIRGGYRIFDKITIDKDHLQILVDNKTFSPGKIVVTQLKNSISAAIYVCSAGSGITDMARKTEGEGDPMLGYILDVIGSVTVNKACEKIYGKIEEEMAITGMNVSDSYSPGYCDWSVSEQQQLFSLLPPLFCGIKLSESSLMHPIKSVSGIIGIGKNLEKKGYQCFWCNDTNCHYGKIRRNRMAKKSMV